MPYAKDRDAFGGSGASRESFGSSARLAADAPASDTTDLNPYPKSVMLLTAGDFKFIPVKNADGKPITIVGLPAGWICPWRVRRIFATGTTATYATIED